jgi:hypothetical protein
MSITAIEGLADLGMWEDAWVALDGLSPGERSTPAALRLRLRCCPRTHAWALGVAVAGMLRNGPTADRNAAAVFYHANARRLINAGDRPGAAASVSAAIETWPDYHMAIMLDPLLNCVGKEPS